MKINCKSAGHPITVKLVLPLVMASLFLTGCGRIKMALNIMEGSGEVGTLADGSGEPEIKLSEGLTVSTTKGHQPLQPSPLPRLPMKNHPYLLDEFASGGVHGRQLQFRSIAIARATGYQTCCKPYPSITRQ